MTNSQTTKTYNHIADTYFARVANLTDTTTETASYDEIADAYFTRTAKRSAK